MKANRVVVYVFVALGAVALSSITYVFGYVSGWVAYGGDAAPVQAAMLTSALKQLREGEIASGIESVDSHLDTYLIQRSAFERDPSFLAELLSSEESEQKLLGFAAEYRKEYPTLHSDYEVQQLLDLIVDKYANKQKSDAAP